MFRKSKSHRRKKERKGRRRRQRGVNTSPVRSSSRTQIPQRKVPLASKNAGNIEERCTTVKKYVHNPSSAKYPHVFHVVFVFSRDIPGLKSVDLSGTFTLWRLVKMRRVEDVKRGIYYHSTLQVPAGTHHYRFTIQVEMKEGAQVWMEEHVVIDDDYSYNESDDFDDPSNILLLDLDRNNHLIAMKEYYDEKSARLKISHSEIDHNSDDDDESAALKELEANKERSLKWKVPKSNLIDRLQMTSLSGRSPGRLPKNIVTVMQEYKKMNRHKENELEKKRLMKLKAKSPYLYSMEMYKQRKKKLAQAKREKGVSSFTQPSPIIYGILPFSQRGQEMLHGVKSTYTLKNVKADSSKHIPKRFNKARLIGTMEKCPALTVFEIEDRVGKILKDARDVAAMLPDNYKSKSKYKPSSSTMRRRGEDKPYIQDEEIQYGIF